MSFQEKPFERWLAGILKWAILAFIVLGTATEVFLDYLPPLEHWAPFTSAKFVAGLVFWVIISFVGVSILKLSQKYLWGLIFSGLIFVFLSLWERADVAFKAANFCYFQALLNEPQPGGGYEWQLRNKQGRIIPFQRMCPYKIVDSEEEYRKCWDPDTCLPEAINQTTANEDPIMPGKYIFKWHTTNSWKQTLEISAPKNAAPTQVGIIYRNDEEIWRFPNGTR